MALGHIGVGGQGGGLLQGMMGQPLAQSVAVCDPIRERRESAARRVDQYYAAQRSQESWKGCRPYNDFRELLARPDIDAVVIATPDHWHVPAALAAVRAGKDVYVEKPLGISIEQNKALREAVHLYGRIFQYGTQQRSFNQHCGFACELLQNGYLGELKADPRHRSRRQHRRAAMSRSRFRTGSITTSGSGPPPTSRIPRTG